MATLLLIAKVWVACGLLYYVLCTLLAVVLTPESLRVPNKEFLLKQPVALLASMAFWPVGLPSILIVLTSSKYRERMLERMKPRQ